MDIQVLKIGRKKFSELKGIINYTKKKKILFIITHKNKTFKNYYNL